MLYCDVYWFIIGFVFSCVVSLWVSLFFVIDYSSVVGGKGFGLFGLLEDRIKCWSKFALDSFVNKLVDYISFSVLISSSGSR